LALEYFGFGAPEHVAVVGAGPARRSFPGLGAVNDPGHASTP